MSDGMIRLYTYEIDVDTLEIKSGEQLEENYDDEYTEYAEFEESLDGRRVYAESLVSLADARQLVYDFCQNFALCVEEINSDIYRDGNEKT